MCLRRTGSETVASVATKTPRVSPTESAVLPRAPRSLCASVLATSSPKRRHTVPDGWSCDPRPDLAGDSRLWRSLITAACRRDGGHLGGLDGALRCLALA